MNTSTLTKMAIEVVDAHGDAAWRFRWLHCLIEAAGDSVKADPNTANNPERAEILLEIAEHFASQFNATAEKQQTEAEDQLQAIRKSAKESGA